MKELELDRIYRRGDNAPGVRRLQEWLCLHGFNVVMDGDFGPATEHALKQFQTRAGLPQTGVADVATFEELTAPMKAALARIKPEGRTFGGLVAAYARQHLQQHPRETRGQNQGPWVRLYMDGNEGKDWAWCAGFATYCVQQAAASLRVPMPVRRTFSCDLLARFARETGRFLSEPATRAERKRLMLGSLLLKRQTPTDWVHTGIVIAIENEVIHTIEGNTNDEGSREGHEVCARIRGFQNMDFVLL
jgi:hypothetical protein